MPHGAASAHAEGLRSHQRGFPHVRGPIRDVSEVGEQVPDPVAIGVDGDPFFEDAHMKIKSSQEKIVIQLIQVAWPHFGGAVD
jgi:hypothetical protein